MPGTQRGKLEMAEGGDEERASSNTPPVFISYASQDATVAEAIVEALERQGLKCWIAPRDVTAGVPYAGQIIHAIDAAKASVLILSRDAAASPHVLREVERTASKRHSIVALRIDQAPLPADFEYFLNTSHWLDASTGDMGRALPRLVVAVHFALNAPAAIPAGAQPSHTPASAVSGRSPNRTSLVVASLLGLGLVGLAADRLWFSSRRAAATQTPTPTAAAPVPATAAPTIPEKSVAVLPFLDMSEKKDQEYFSDGLSEELIDMLTKIPELRVPARTSSFYFKGKQATIADIAKVLSVAHVLEGSVRKSGNHLRITAQLVRADNGYHLWSETYDRQLDDIFKVQDEIARAVVKALKISLMGGSLPVSTGTQDGEAYNLFLQARSMLRRVHGGADHKRVVEYTRRAVDADPQFASAWALLSIALASEGLFLIQEGTEGDVAAHQLIEARRAAKQALKLNSSLPEPHIVDAYILLNVDFDVRAADAQIQQALELNPNHPWALYWADTLPMFRGDFDEALTLVQKSIAIDPVNPIPYADLTLIYYFAGKFPEALAANRKMLDLDPGARESYYSMAAFISLAKGDAAAALTEIESEKTVRENCACLVLAYDALGRKADADVALANLEKHHANDSAYEIGLVYANRGEFDQAFGWFDRAYRQHDAELLHLKVSPRTENVRSDPRFNALLRKLDLLD
jgi:TolB-like protein